MLNNIRNFVIIAHIDHGKSTLADRFLEITGTVDRRQMKPQYLDQLELERERGITIKMAPVRMIYKTRTDRKMRRDMDKIQPETTNADINPPLRASGREERVYILNLIDTPGHSDFSYEVSRALASVEGAILLVDATQGIQAQTLANFYAARKAGLEIIGAVNKIDAVSDRPGLIDKTAQELANLLGVGPEEIFKTSGKTGEGARELLEAVIARVPAPGEKFAFSRTASSSDIGKSMTKIKNGAEGNAAKPHLRALIFDSCYDEHKGIIAFVRIFEGEYKAGDRTALIAARTAFNIKEVGYFSPKFQPAEKIVSGEIGYIATGIKDLNKLRIGDTIGDAPLPGYKEPLPVVFISLYPEEAEQYDDFKAALFKLRLNDSSISIEPDLNEVLGRGFRCGFLGQLHFEITAERLEKEFNIKTVGTFPFVVHKIRDQSGEEKIIKSAEEIEEGEGEILEPMIKIAVIAPADILGNALRLKEIFRLRDISTDSLAFDSENKIVLKAKMPLSSLLYDFDSQLKSVSAGMASWSYELAGYEPAEVLKTEILAAGEVVPGLTRLTYKDELERESRKMLKKLKEILPRQQFSQALQARAGGRIIARENIPALRKDVTGYLYGGDRTRKMKLWKKQKKGKAKLKERGRVEISAKVFKELLKK